MSALAKLSARFNPLLAPLQQRWQALEARQQRLIRRGAVIALLLLIVAYAWLPAARERQRLIALLPQMSTQLAQMKLQAQEIALPNTGQAAAPSRAAPDSTQLQALFGDGARASLDANRAFRIVIPKIAYAAWWDRVSDAQARFPLRVTSLSMQALPGGNREVSIDMTLADATRPIPTASAGAAAK